MKRLLSIVMIAVFAVGCMSAHQLEAEKAYYKAVSQKGSAQQPLVVLAPSEAGKPVTFDGNLTVYAPAQNTPVQQYVQKDYAAPWISLFGNIASVAAPWIGAASIVKSVANITGNTSVSGTGNTLNYGSIDNTSVPTVVTPAVVNPEVVVVEPSYPPK